MNKEASSTLPKRLAQLRYGKNLSQVELAKIFNLNPSTIANYETGNRSPSYNLLVQLADYFGVSVDWLLGRTNSPHTSTIETALESLDPKIQHILLNDKDNALPLLEFAADCIENGISIKQVKSLLQNIISIKGVLDEVD